MTVGVAGTLQAARRPAGTVASSALHAAGAVAAMAFAFPWLGWEHYWFTAGWVYDDALLSWVILLFGWWLSGVANTVLLVGVAYGVWRGRSWALTAVTVVDGWVLATTVSWLILGDPDWATAWPFWIACAAFSVAGAAVAWLPPARAYARVKSDEKRDFSHWNAA